MTSGDVDAAAAFYKQVVGWDVRDSGMPGMQYMIFGKDIAVARLSWQLAESRSLTSLRDDSGVRTRPG